MDIKDIKKHISVGHLRKSFVVSLILIFVLCIGTPFVYYFYSALIKPTPVDNDYVNNQSSFVAEDMLNDLSKEKGGLWFANYIWIDGSKYQLKYAKDGSLKVLKNGHLVPIDKAVGAQGAIVNKDGKMYLYTPDGRLLDLKSGDILATDDGVLEVKGSSVKPLDSDELVAKDNKLNYVDPQTADTHQIKDGEVVTVNGRAMKLVSGVLKPLIHPSSGLADGSYLTQDDQYYLKQNGSLIPVKTNSLKDGTTVYLDNKPMVFHDGQLYSKEQSNLGVLTLDDLNKILINDYVLRMGLNKLPAYYIKQLHNFASIDKASIPNYALVYFMDKPYQIVNSKLHKFKVEIGEPFIKVGKPFVIIQDSRLLMLKSGDMVKYHGVTLIVNDKDRFVVVDQKLADALKHFPNRLIVIDGKQRLYGKQGKVSDLINNNLVFRNGEPYKYIDGKWVKLSPTEINALTHKNSKKVSQKKVSKPIDNQTKVQKPVVVKKQTQEQSKPAKPFFGKDQKQNLDPDELVLISQSPIEVQGQVDNSSEQEGISKPISSDISPEDQKTLKHIDNMMANANSYQQQSQYDRQNDQSGKQAFLDSQAKGKLGHFDYPDSTYYLSTGTSINITMVTSINSDLPGNIEAIVNTNVYDSASHNYVLIPAGTLVWGAYSSNVSYGQQRIIMAWNKLIFPNGMEMDLAGQEGYDLTGQAGLTGEVDNHYWSLFKNVAMLSLFSAASSIGTGSGNSSSLNGLSLFSQSIAQNVSTVGSQLIEKVTNVQPRIKVDQGTESKILLVSRINFKSPYVYQKPINAVWR